MVCSNYPILISGLQSLFLVLFLGVCPNQLQSQSSEVSWLDGNQDGYAEKIEVYREAGNYFYEDRIIITDTISGRQDSFVIQGNLGQFTVTLPLTSQQLQPDQLYLLNDLAVFLTGESLYQGYDSATLALGKLKIQDACLNFCDYPKAGCQDWIPGIWTEESVHLHLITSDLLTNHLLEQPYLQLYYGHNHTSNGFVTQRLGLAPQDTLVVSRHGLIRQQEDRYTWLFHSDEELGAPRKLRWASFGNTTLRENLLFVEQNGLEEYLLVFNWETGRWLRYVLDLYERYEIKDNLPTLHSL